ncbi:MAG: hypothetical protein ACRCXL_02630 [Dermatophilaceae bacterium]
MTFYSDLPVRRLRQVTADLGILLWTTFWVRVGAWVHDATLQLAEPGRRLADAGSGFRGTMTTAGDSVDDLPVLRDRVATPFRSVAGVGSDLEDAGAGLVDAVERLALVLTVTTVLAPVVTAGAVWLRARWRFIRQASAAQRLVDADADLDLFALRAMANQPMARLAAITDDPAGAWRRRDREVVRALAVLELRDAGLRPPV